MPLESLDRVREASMTYQSDGTSDYEDVQAHVRFLSAEAYRGNLSGCPSGEQCEDCPWASLVACAIASDTEFMALLHVYASEHAAAEQLRERRVNALVKILQRHKLAMHWEFVARIAIEAESDLFPSDRSVLGILVHHPERFSEDSAGSYILAGTMVRLGN